MKRLVPIIVIVVLAAGVCYYAYVRAHAERGIAGPVLSVRFLDADYGNAIVVRTPERKVFVIDPPSGRAGKASARLLHDEHIGEAGVIRTDAATDPAGAGRRLSPSVTARMLGPSVLRIRYGGKSILFLPDIGTKAESEMIRSGRDLTSSVLVVPPKGVSLELLSLVRPEVIVIGSATKPSASVIDRLSERNTGAALYRTDKHGIIEIDTNGRSIRVSTEGGGP